MLQVHMWVIAWRRKVLPGLSNFWHTFCSVFTTRSFLKTSVTLFMSCKLVRPHTHMHMQNAENYMLTNKDSVANNLKQVFPVSVFSYTTHGHKLALPPCLLWRPGVTVGVKGLTQRLKWWHSCSRSNRDVLLQTEVLLSREHGGWKGNLSDWLEYSQRKGATDCIFAQAAPAACS